MRTMYISMMDSHTWSMGADPRHLMIDTIAAMEPTRKANGYRIICSSLKSFIQSGSVLKGRANSVSAPFWST